MITRGTGLTVNPTLASSLISNGFYFNVHTALNGGGAVRGQLEWSNAFEPLALGVYHERGGLPAR